MADLGMQEGMSNIPFMPWAHLHSWHHENKEF